MTKRDDARQDYLAGMKYKDIAEKYDVSLSTVKSWKSRYWSDETKVATSDKKVATKTEKVATKKELHPAIQELADSDLNDRQKCFVIEYVRLANATQAYINAYDCDYDSARANAPRMIANDSIQTEIKRLREARMVELSVGVFDLVDDLAAEAKADIGDYVDWGSNEFSVKDEDSGQEYTKHKSWVALRDKSEVETKLVKKVTVGKDGPVLEMHDKSKARDTLLDYLLHNNRFAGLEEDNQEDVMQDSLLNAITSSSKEVFGDGDEIET
ncbi:terminase small subunit [Leuconostocaceae bacterium ESL0958]|nr:terminase small subunit [Leuconostocaceae bacterium ESL0958]